MPPPRFTAGDALAPAGAAVAAELVAVADRAEALSAAVTAGEAARVASVLPAPTVCVGAVVFLLLLLEPHAAQASSSAEKANSGRNRITWRTPSIS